MNKAVFLDKDGTLVSNVPYNVDPTKIEFNTGVFDGLKLLQGLGYKLVIVSNQRGLALGKFTKQELEKNIRHIKSELNKREIKLDGFYYCPHDPDSRLTKYAKACECRKPKPGMIAQAAKDIQVDLRESWVIGDILNDVEAGNRIGCKTILINNGNEKEWLFSEKRVPKYQVKNLWDAAQAILGDQHG